MNTLVYSDNRGIIMANYQNCLDFYPDSLNKLNILYSFSKKISIIDGAKPATNRRTEILEKTVEKILLHDKSILTLLFSLASNSINEIDVSLIASATRNIMESANQFFYVSERGLSTEELNFRMDIMHRNEVVNIIDIANKLGFSQNCFRAGLDKGYLDHLNNEFKESAKYLELKNHEITHILSGRKPTFQAKPIRILENEIESAVFNLLSNSVHGFRLGLVSNSFNKTSAFHNFFNTEQLLVLSLIVSRIYTAHVVKDYLDLRKRLYSLLEPNEKSLLKSYMSCDDLSSYIQVIRSQYEKDPISEILNTVNSNHTE